MDRKIDPTTGDYTGTRTVSIENAVWIRLATPLGSYPANTAIGSRLHELPRKDTAEVRALAEQYAWQALKPLIDDGRAQSIQVTAVRKRVGWVDLSIRVELACGEVATFEHPVKVV
ncbi:hypothetical protein C4N37_13305 [Salmonella enterica]|nr:hypothetical protein [Salmonella enterica]ECS7051521.1 hypothetical protein [Salmonella enterica subsp. enterica serovar Oranienburg]EBS9186020.1 hypothetical protein [Salmonella enterica]EEB7676660.1 hypothetical protein [Salmonella enterica]EEE1618225.1 hypothetical protein [Salmonella enterica subsp. enterica serovar Oranienburg]